MAHKHIYKITWHLTGGRRIEKQDEGAQQAFSKMSRRERMAITLDCLNVTYVLVTPTGKGS